MTTRRMTVDDLRMTVDYPSLISSAGRRGCRRRGWCRPTAGLEAGRLGPSHAR